MTEHHRAQHDLLRQLLGFGFDHQHAVGGSGDHQVEPTRHHLVDPRVEHVLAIDVADAAAADRAEERHAREGQRRRRADQRDDVGVVLQVVAEHGADDLRLVAKALDEQRADRPVDQAGGQDLAFGRPAFPLEKSAGDLAGGKRLFLVVDGQREEIETWLRRLLIDDRTQNLGFSQCGHDRTIGLPGNLAGFQDQRSPTPLNFFPEFVKHSYFPLQPGRSARQRRPATRQNRRANQD